jgi:hypothetical protein
MEPVKNKHVKRSVAIVGAFLKACITAVVVKLVLGWFMSLEPFASAHNAGHWSTALAAAYAVIVLAVAWDDQQEGLLPRDRVLLAQSLGQALLLVGCAKFFFLFVIATEPGGDAHVAGIITTIVAAPLGLVVWVFAFNAISNDYLRAKHPR